MSKKYPTVQIPTTAKRIRDQNKMLGDSAVYADDKNVYKDYNLIDPRSLELYHCLQTYCATHSREVEPFEAFMLPDIQGETRIKKITIKVLPLDPDQVYRHSILYKNTLFPEGSYSIVPRVHGEGLDKIIVRMNDAYAKASGDQKKGKHKNSGHIIAQLEKHIEESIKSMCYQIVQEASGAHAKDIFKNRDRKLGNINMMTEIKDDTLHITVTDIVAHIFPFLRLLEVEKDKIINYTREKLKDTLQGLIAPYKK